MAHRWGNGRRLGRTVVWTEEKSAQVAGGQRRARSGVQGKGGMKGRDRSQEAREEGRGRGTGRAGEAGYSQGTSEGSGGPVEAAGLAGSILTAGVTAAGERWDSGWEGWVSRRRVAPRAKSRGLTEGRDRGSR